MESDTHVIELSTAIPNAHELEHSFSVLTTYTLRVVLEEVLFAIVKDNFSILLVILKTKYDTLVP